MIKDEDMNRMYLDIVRASQAGRLTDRELAGALYSYAGTARLTADSHPCWPEWVRAWNREAQCATRMADDIYDALLREEVADGREN